MKTYVVRAPYVTLRARNSLGQEVVTERYQDAPVPESANREDVARLLRKGMIAEVDASEEPASTGPVEAKPEEPKKAAPVKRTGSSS